MKRFFCVILIAVFFVFNGCEGKQDNLVLIDSFNKAGELHSFLVDYNVQENTVTFTCCLYIENTTEDIIEFEIYGYYEEDVESGFILDQNMKAIDTETKSDLFIIKPLEKKLFYVEFIAQRGNDTNIKTNRLLPEITFCEKTSDSSKRQGDYSQKAGDS